MKAAAYALFALTTTLAILAFGCALGAVWVVGDNSERLTMTAFILIAVGMFTAIGASALLGVHDINVKYGKDGSHE